MSKEEIRHFKSLLRQGSLRHMNILLDDKFQSELLNIIKDYELLEKENKQLKEDMKVLFNENNNKEKVIIKQKDNWNKLKEYLINDINDRNGTKIVEFEEGNRVSETISPIYTLMEDKSRTMKEVLDKMQELEQGSDSNE